MNWNRPDNLDQLDTYLRTRSIAVSSVIGGTLDPFETRLDKLAGSYDRDLFHDATLKDLGHDRATDLDGGFQAWRAAGLPVEPLGPDAA